MWGVRGKPVGICLPVWGARGRPRHGGLILCPCPTKAIATGAARTGLKWGRSKSSGAPCPRRGALGRGRQRDVPSQRDVGEGTSLFGRDAKAQQKGWLPRGVDVERNGHTSKLGLEVRGAGAATALLGEGAARRSRPCQGWLGQVDPRPAAEGRARAAAPWLQSPSPHRRPEGIAGSCSQHTNEISSAAPRDVPCAPSDAIQPRANYFARPRKTPRDASRTPGSGHWPPPSLARPPPLAGTTPQLSVSTHAVALALGGPC